MVINSRAPVFDVAVSRLTLSPTRSPQQLLKPSNYFNLNGYPNNNINVLKHFFILISYS